MLRSKSTGTEKMSARTGLVGSRPAHYTSLRRCMQLRASVEGTDNSDNSLRGPLYPACMPRMVLTSAPRAEAERRDGERLVEKRLSAGRHTGAWALSRREAEEAEAAKRRVRGARGNS